MIGRIPITDVSPVVSCGRWPAKAVVGETVTVSATVFREGHDAVAANVALRGPGGAKHPFTPLRPIGSGTDRWAADVTVTSEGRWTFVIEAWSDPLATWRHDAEIKVPLGQDLELVFEEGARLHERAASGLPREHRPLLTSAVATLRDESRTPDERLRPVLD